MPRFTDCDGRAVTYREETNKGVPLCGTPFVLYVQLSCTGNLYWVGVILVENRDANR